MEGLKAVGTDEEAQGRFSIEYMERKGKEALAALQKPPAEQVLIASNLTPAIPDFQHGKSFGVLSDGTNALATHKEVSDEAQIADNSSTREAKTEEQKRKDASDKQSPELAELHRTIDAIRDSEILTAQGRTLGGNVEYKMVIFKDGTHTKAYQNRYIGTDPVTHSDVYTCDPALAKEILVNTVKGNGLAKLIHSHPNKKGMQPDAFSKEDIAESNAANVDSILLGPDGRLFLHKAKPEGRLMDPANITEEMRHPDKVLGRFDAEGKFHPAKYDGKNVTFETKGF